MSLNPFSRRRKRDRAKDRANLAVEAVREAAESVRDQSNFVLGSLPEPPKEKGRGPLALAAVVAAVAAVGYGLKKAFGGSSPASDVSYGGAQSPTATAPMGPTDPRLNDPALKAKVESEIFAAEDAPKDKVSVDVSDGVVTLRGTLDDQEQGSELASTAEGVDGVRRVENLLETS